MIAAVIVTYNRIDMLRECVASLLRQTLAGETGIIVVDNGSSDGTCEAMRKLEAEGKLIYLNTGRNLGGAGGFSFGMKYAVTHGYEYVWVMDDDCIPKPTALEELMRTAGELGDDWGFLSSRALWTDGSVCRMNVQKTSLWSYLDVDATGRQRVIMASFVSLLVPARRIMEHGLPIEEFFIWTDDWEFTRRLSMEHPCYAVPESIVVHKSRHNKGADIVRDSSENLDRYRYLYRNDVYLYRREGLQGLLYELCRLGYHSLRIMATTDRRAERFRTMWGATFKGLAFRPEPQKLYDYVIVGAGITGAAAARLLTDRGCRVLVVERRNHIAGNCYTSEEEGIMVHKYGAHIFHTDREDVWEFVNQYACFNDYVHTVTADYKGERYSLPFNMNTFYEMWGIETEKEARSIIERQKGAAGITEPANLEEQAIALVGTDLYEKLIRGYTQKQWGRDCRELPAFIIRRLPLRFTWNNNYFNARYQGIPCDGYTSMIEKMLDGIEVITGVDYIENKAYYESISGRILYTGQLDELMDYCYGQLEYRGLRFENEHLDCRSFQDRAVVNYTSRDIPWTRIIEHKWFMPEAAETTGTTIITREYASEWKRGEEPFYPVNDNNNNSLYLRYRELVDDSKYILLGRLAEYRYYDMDAAIARVIDTVSTLTR